MSKNTWESGLNIKDICFLMSKVYIITEKGLERTKIPINDPILVSKTYSNLKNPKKSKIQLKCL